MGNIVSVMAMRQLLSVYIHRLISCGLSTVRLYLDFGTESTKLVVEDFLYRLTTFSRHYFNNTGCIRLDGPRGGPLF